MGNDWRARLGKLLSIDKENQRKSQPGKIVQNKNENHPLPAQGEQNVQPRVPRCAKTEDDTLLMTREGFALSKEQAGAVRQLQQSHENFFVTGKAGTGKSVVLRYLIDHSEKNTAVVAPTGIAAVNVGGQTIHSFFGMKPVMQDVKNPGQVEVDSRRESLLNALETLIIDEISMVRSDIMDMMDHKLRAAKMNPHVPFGGCQIIAFGDLYQLPPVVEKDDEARRFLYDTYGSEYFFAAPGVIEKPFTVLELKEVHRQSDPEFISVLNAIRVGQCEDSVLSPINSRCVPADESSLYITLTPSRAAADTINRKELQKIQAPEYTYPCVIEGDFDANDAIADGELHLKVGAHVMMIKNDSAGRWTNGTAGVVDGLSKDKVVVRINETAYPIDREVWSKYSYLYNRETHQLEREVTGSLEQYPVKLAYAATIHKSQGQTYKSVKIDYSMGRAFAPGQTYVALSRCESLQGLYLERKILKEDIKTSREVTRYLNGEPYEKLSGYISTPDSTGPIKWLPGNRIQVEPPRSPKKMTGTRLAGVVNLNNYKSPFAMWCELTKTYEEPFIDNKFTIAGKAIEPKQFVYAKGRIPPQCGEVVSPQDVYGAEPEKKMGYDFFPDEDIFGGMWDYLLKKDGVPAAVLEMKTTNCKNQRDWLNGLPKANTLQAALYAWLLHVDDVYMVSSFLQNGDYDNPDAYRCSESNSFIHHFKMSEKYPDFEEKFIEPALKWWADYVETGISPQFDPDKDRKILDELRSRESD